MKTNILIRNSLIYGQARGKVFFYELFFYEVVEVRYNLFTFKVKYIYQFYAENKKNYRVP